jgi:tetratricopeptide (TPR) repeat protein
MGKVAAISASWVLAGCAGFFKAPEPRLVTSEADWIAQGDQAYEGGRFAAAVVHYREAARRGQQTAVAYFNMAHCLVRLERHPEAMAAYRLSLREAPVFVRAHQNLAALYHLEGQPALAAQHYRRVVELNTQDVNALYRLGELARAGGDCIEAQSWFTRAIQIEPKEEAAWSGAIQCELEMGDTSAAIARLEALQEKTRAGIWSPLLLGDLRRSQGLTQEAFTAWESAIALDQTDRRSWMRIASLRRELGQGALAAASIQSALEREPKAGDLWVTLAGLRLEIDDPVGALYAYGQALSLGEAEGWQGLERVARWHEKRGDSTSAMTIRKSLAGR